MKTVPGKPSVADTAVTYAAFLRGINVGGNKAIKMADLQKAFEKLGFKNVKTILASGNVLFDVVAPPADAELLVQTIEAGLARTFGRPISVLLRSSDALQRLFAAKPFQGVKVTPQTRLYVSFLPQKTKTKTAWKAPYVSPDKTFTVTHLTPGEVCSTFTLSEAFQTTDLMQALEKEFGRNITTRNWNTIARILKAGD